jgi:hypothetical protein
MKPTAVLIQIAPWRSSLSRVKPSVTAAVIQVWAVFP